MENENGIIKLTRQQIYDDIWKLSVAGVARKYNLQYARLIKSCREADIPFPSSGYWARKNFGTPEWIEWASRKADWYDPTKDVEDEYLGKREHGKNKEEKDIDKVSVKRGWYW